MTGLRIAKLDAVDPLRQIPTDAVEAALQAYQTFANECGLRLVASPDQRREAIVRAIAAADAARGRSYVDWRRVEEYEPDGGDILAHYRMNRPGEAICEFTIAISRTRELPEDVIAWAEVPTPPPWIEPTPPPTPTQSSEAGAEAQAAGDAQKDPAAALELECLFTNHCGREPNRFTYCSHPWSACVHAGNRIALPPPRALEDRVTHLEQSLRAVMERMAVPALDDGRIAAALRGMTNG